MSFMQSPLRDRRIFKNIKKEKYRLKYTGISIAQGTMGEEVWGEGTLSLFPH